MKKNKVHNHKKGRSKITNKTTFHGVDVDGRSSTPRRIRDIYRELQRLVVVDGREPTMTEEGLMRQLSALLTHQEMEAAKLADGAEFDAKQFVSSANTINRLFMNLGLMPDEDGAEDDDPDLAGIDALEVYCARKKAAGNSKHKRKKDGRSERSAPRVRL